MLYDGSNPLHAAQARARLERLVKDGKVFDLTEKKPPKTDNQMGYLHAIIRYYAAMYGCTEAEAKVDFFKTAANLDIFCPNGEKRRDGKPKLRSTKELDKGEMTLAIDRFRNWAAANEVFPLYLPAPDEERQIQLAELEAERCKEYM